MTPAWVKISLLVTTASMHFVACASDTLDVDALHVDIETIAKTRSVIPVDGISVSGQPNEAALEVFAASGYEAVIDIRGANEKRGMEEAAVVEQFGMRYVNFPVEGRNAINFENAAKLNQLIGSFDGPVLVHCGSGNRVGALLALQKVVEGADDEVAIAYGKQAGLTRLERVVRERLQERK